MAPPSVARARDSNRPVRSAIMTIARSAAMTMAMCLVVLLAVVAAADGEASTASAPAVDAPDPKMPNTDVTQPGPPIKGPGRVSYLFNGWRVGQGGSGPNAYYVFAPRTRSGASATETMPRHLPLALVLHGYGDYTGFQQMYELVRHTVLAGNVVIYPRWQTDVASPCPGPLNIEPCMDSALAGIRGGLQFLAQHPRWVQPRLDRTSYFGFSFGGIITANLANRYQRLGLPKPRAIFFDDPHDGALTGTGEPALDDSLAGIPAATKIECHSGAEGVIGEPGTAGGSCNSLFPLLAHVPVANKALVMTRPDAHGTPALSSAHGVCAGGRGSADAYDWNFCWKVWDALRSVAYGGRWGRYALGNTLAHSSIGAWSDGVAIEPLVVQTQAPLVP